MSAEVTKLDLPKVIGLIRMSFDKQCAARGWVAAPEATARVIEIASRELGAYPTVFQYGIQKCSVMLVWEAYKRNFVVNVYLDGSVCWTLSKEYGFSYEDQDGEGTGKAFLSVLRRLRKHKEQTRC